MSKLLTFLRYFCAWAIAVFLTIVVGISFQTQNVIARLNDIGGDVSFGQRISMTLYDIIHLGTVYGLFIAIALIIAFLAGGLLFHFTKFGRPIIYMVAGGVAILVMLFAMKQAFFGIQMIAGARDITGISLQALTGVMSGFIFSKLTKNIRPKKNPT